MDEGLSSHWMDDPLFASSMAGIDVYTAIPVFLLYLLSLFFSLVFPLSSL